MIFIYGPEKFLIEQEVQRIRKEHNDKVLEIFRFDDQASINDLISSASSNNLFTGSKLFLIYALPFFDKSILKDDLKNADDLINAINVNNQDIFVFINENIISKDKISVNSWTKFIFENNNHEVTMIEAKEISESKLFSLAKSLANKHKLYIDDEAIKLLINKVNNDTLMLSAEIIKLSNLEKHISAEVIENSTDTMLGDDVFAFSNALETNDLGIIWSKYKEKMLEGTEISALIGQISQIFIIAHQIYAYKVCHLSIDQLSRDLKLNSYRIKKISYFLSKIGINKIKKMILSLSKLDKDIKNGLISEKIGFERFLITFFN
ncbi:DNA polymerase III subunit delta [Mycoplasmopsis bovis]|uniref:DNA polymerase III subunit delta n=1 Tax=Mycoplasmopsis bovis TaxID=28903 RepID=UPI001CF16DB2|nr:DNA polymerase III subunit delta [Mycoplasmopsis bovis]MCA8861281.1 DNA polymerase III subunit delta [Mycoplasmopsis bovis]UCP04795.1 DNA polymerase III subunit delta [Mycoplasmopsis bovis]